ncbi:MAG: ABC transporter permease [Thermoleophilaceae bacterium]|nr:ABC transporter permease [Thermoleophilaceae bacterium]
MQAHAADAVTTPGSRVISPRPPGVFERLRELWTYRRLIRFFGRRALEKRYLRTWIGWPWIPLRPVLEVGSRALLFGGLLGVPSQGIPYPIFLLVGMAAWELFDRTAFWAMRSLDINKSILRRIYVPRLTVVAGAIVPSGIEYLIYGVITAIIMLVYWLGDGVLYAVAGPQTLVALAGLALLIAMAYGIGMVLSVYAAQARDVRFIYGYIMGFWLFLTPVLYPLSAIPPFFQTLADVNPMTAPIVMVKYGFLGIGEVTTTSLIATFVAIAVFLGGGLRFFNAAETRTLDSF